MGWSEVLFGNLWKHEEKLTSHLTFVVVVQLLSHVRLFAIPWTTARQASLSISVPRSLLKLMPIELVMPSNHLIPCNPLLLLPSIFPSIRVFSNESVLRIRWPKYWSFSFSISPSNEYSGLISFRIDWFDLLAVQGTQECSPTPQFKNINSLASSFLYKVQLSHPHFPGGSDGKASVYNVGDPGSIPGSGRSSGEGNGNPLQYSCLPWTEEPGRLLFQWYCKELDMTE